MAKHISIPPPLGKKLYDTPSKRISNLISIFSLDLDKGVTFHTYNYKSFRAYFHVYLKEYNNDFKPEEQPKKEFTFQKIDKNNYNVWRIK